MSISDFQKHAEKIQSSQSEPLEGIGMQLKVEIDGHSGFCFGVVYAIEMAEEILENEGILYCLGDIVHNDEEIERLKKKGLQIIDHNQLASLTGVKVLIRAHGEPPETYRIALENDIELIDASCPVVLKLQNRIRNSFEKESNLFIYGKHGHAEVLGLQGQTEGNATVFQSLDELDIDNLPRKISLYSQTTKSRDSFYSIHKELTEKGIEVDLNDTICRQVSNRDEELREFATRFDQIVFVSGKKSSNGKVLFEVCKESNPQTFFVSSCHELKSEWFLPNSTIGICGATSTPMWLMEEVKACLEKL
jgi:4-hydroxy-3-methylbut-2-enyl diphosphate reductase